MPFSLTVTRERRTRRSGAGPKIRLNQPWLADYADRNTAVMPGPEYKVWLLLRRQRVHFIPQYPISGWGRWYILDFFCKSRGIAVEIDGHEHNHAADAERDTAMMTFHKVRTLRFTNEQARSNTKAVVAAICQAAKVKMR